MERFFWPKRFLVVFLGAFAIIATVQLLKGHTLHYATTEAGMWSLVSALVFTIARYQQARRGQHCAICKDTPEMQEPGPENRN